MTIDNVNSAIENLEAIKPQLVRVLVNKRNQCWCEACDDSKSLTCIF